MKVSFIRPEIGDGHVKSVVVLPLFTANKKTSKTAAPILCDAAKAYDGVCSGVIKSGIKAGGSTGQAGKSFEIVGPKGTKSNRLYIAGAGIKSDFDAEMFGARVCKALMMSGETSLVLHLDGLGLEPADGARAAMGAVLAVYRFDQYRTKLTDDKKPSLKSVKIAIENPTKARAAYANFYGPVAEGTALARDLVMEPANKLFPKSYAKRIKSMEKLGMKVEILGEKRMASLGMHALLGVGLGSERESQLVIMKWMGGKKNEQPVCLVGKGVTFDTGGISLKPGGGMWDMKGDMGGSAAVVGAMHTLAARKAKANVIGIVGLVENMPDGKAQNPGDIVTSMSGQTIEVQNTDAEGRLVLCDALWYAQEKFKPKAMLNLATLTGAILVALGHEYAGVFANDDTIAKQLEAAAEHSTQKVWRLPFDPEFDKLLNSPNADMKNIGGRLAGSITAGQFLKRFVKDVPWAHIDIAGTAWKAKSADPREPAWATGYGARLLNRWVADNYEG